MPPPAPDISRWDILFFDFMGTPQKPGMYGYLFTQMERIVAQRPGLALYRIGDDDLTLWRAYDVTGFPVFIARLDGIVVSRLCTIHFLNKCADTWLEKLLGPVPSSPTP